MFLRLCSLILLAFIVSCASGHLNHVTEGGDIGEEREIRFR